MSVFNSEVVLSSSEKIVLAEDLGYGSVVRDKDGDLWVKFRDVGWFAVTGGHLPGPSDGSETLPAIYGPYTLYDRGADRE